MNICSHPKPFALDHHKLCQLLASILSTPSKSDSTLSQLATNICSHLVLSSINTCINTCLLASSPHIQTSLLLLRLALSHSIPPSTIASRAILSSSSIFEPSSASSRNILSSQRLTNLQYLALHLATLSSTISEQHQPIHLARCPESRR